MSGPLAGLRVVELCGALRTSSPLLGQETHAVLSEVLGMTDEEIASLEKQGVLM